MKSVLRIFKFQQTNRENNVPYETSTRSEERAIHCSDRRCVVHEKSFKKRRFCTPPKQLFDDHSVPYFVLIQNVRDFRLLATQYTCIIWMLFAFFCLFPARRTWRHCNVTSSQKGGSLLLVETKACISKIDGKKSEPIILLRE